MGNSGIEPGETRWQQARDDALAVLNAVLRWHLSASSWQQVAEIVAEMAAAVAAVSPDALWAASDQLHLYSPLRVDTRLGDQSQAPSGLRDQVAELVVSLGGTSARDDQTARSSTPELNG